MPETFDIEWPMPGRLAVMPRPLGGDALPGEIEALRMAGVNVLVSALTPSDERKLDLTREPELAKAADLLYIPFPIRDFGVPPIDDLVDLASSIGHHLRRGRFVAVHCRGGVGRSGLIACATLIDLGANAAEAIDAVSKSRGHRVPETPGQRRLLRRLAG